MRIKIVKRRRGNSYKILSRSNNLYCPLLDKKLEKKMNDLEHVFYLEYTNTSFWITKYMDFNKF